MQTPLVEKQQDSQGYSSSPEEKIRIRLAAEAYRSFGDNTNNNNDKEKRCKWIGAIVYFVVGWCGYVTLIMSTHRIMYIVK